MRNNLKLNKLIKNSFCRVRLQNNKKETKLSQHLNYFYIFLFFVVIRFIFFFKIAVARNKGKQTLGLTKISFFYFF